MPLPNRPRPGASAAIAEAAVAAVTPPKSSPDVDAAAAIAAPVTEVTAPAAATAPGAASRLPRESGAPRGRAGALVKEKKRRVTVILGPTGTQNAIFGALELQK